MNKAKSFLFYFLAFILSQVFIPTNAHAYIDPGSGSYVVEALIAMLIAGFFALKLYWRKIIGIFTGKKNGKNKP